MCTRALGQALPSQRSRDLGRGAAAARLVGARRDGALLRLAAAEPPRVVERHADGDRELARPRSCRSASSTRRCRPGCRCTGSARSCGSAPRTRSGRGTRRQTICPSTAPVTSIGSGRSSFSYTREIAPDAVDAQEVQRDAEVLREQVRHAHARGLVRHAERVAEVLDGEVAVLLRLLQERDRRRLGHEAARGEVVDLEPLLQEVGVVGRPRVAEQAVRHGLQRHRPQAVAAGDRCRRQVDAAVLEVGHRARRVRQVVDVDQLEAELLGHDAHRAVRERARARAPRP